MAARSRRLRAARSPGSGVPGGGAASLQWASVGSGSEAMPAGVSRALAQRRRFGAGEPRVAERGEDAERAALPGEHLVGRVQCDVVAGGGFDAAFAAQPFEPPFLLAAERVGVAVEGDEVGAALVEQARDLIDRPAAADDQAPAERGEVGGERRERAAQELLAAGGVQQGGVVGDAQVAPEPVDGEAAGGGHGKGCSAVPPGPAGPIPRGLAGGVRRRS